MKTWKHLFYFVAAPRNDGTAPDLNKACEGKVFLTYDDAERYRNHVSKKIGYDYKVFIGQTVIPREKPVEQEVGLTFESCV